jgi:hypothetical protein
MPAAWASSSTSCSVAKQVCGQWGARIADVLKNRSQSGRDLPVTRRAGNAYCVPGLSPSAEPSPGGLKGMPTFCITASEAIDIGGSSSDVNVKPTMFPRPSAPPARSASSAGA